MSVKKEEYPHKMWIYWASYVPTRNIWRSTPEANVVEFHCLEAPFKKSAKSFHFPYLGYENKAARVLSSIGHKMDRARLDCGEICHDRISDGCIPPIETQVIWVAYSSRDFEANARAMIADNMGKMADTLENEVYDEGFSKRERAKALREMMPDIAVGFEGQKIVPVYRKTAFLYQMDTNRAGDRFEMTMREFRWEEGLYGAMHSPENWPSELDWMNTRKIGEVATQEFYTYNRFSVVELVDDLVAAKAKLVAQFEKSMEGLSKKLERMREFKAHITE